MTRPAPAQSFTPEERRKYLGASEIAAVMGLDRWKTPLDVWREKVGTAQPFEGNAHTERGKHLEPKAAELFTELTGQKLRRTSNTLVHPKYPFIVGHVDRLVVGQQSIAEIKCPSVAAFRRYQREGLPEAMIVQMQMYLGLANEKYEIRPYRSGKWLIFCADQWEMAMFDIEFDETIYNAAIKAAVEFWETNVMAGIEPAADKYRDDTLTFATGGTVEHRDDEPFLTKAAALREAIELKSDAEELFESAKADMINAFEQQCGIYECPGLRIHYTEQAGRKTLDRKAVAAAGIDLTPFERNGAPFKTFRTYLLNNTEGEK